MWPSEITPLAVVNVLSPAVAVLLLCPHLPLLSPHSGAVGTVGLSGRGSASPVRIQNSPFSALSPPPAPPFPLRCFPAPQLHLTDRPRRDPRAAPNAPNRTAPFGGGRGAEPGPGVGAAGGPRPHLRGRTDGGGVGTGSGTGSGGWGRRAAAGLSGGGGVGSVRGAGAGLGAGLGAGSRTPPPLPPRPRAAAAAAAPPGGVRSAPRRRTAAPLRMESVSALPVPRNRRSAQRHRALHPGVALRDARRRAALQSGHGGLRGTRRKGRVEGIGGRAGVGGRRGRRAGGALGLGRGVKRV